MQWQKQKASVEQLKLALRALNNKIEEAKRKKTLLVARQKRAEAQSKIQETMSGLKNASAFEALTDGEQGRSDGGAGRGARGADRGVQRRHAGAEVQELSATAGAEEDLIALKRKMGVLPPEAAPAPVRVATPGPADVSAPLDAAEEEELARALAELEAEEQRAPLQTKR